MPVFISHRHSDTDLAMQIDKFLKECGIETYLDVLDRESQSTDDITSTITKNIMRCTHLLAVMTPDTVKSWWVPFEIGEATITDRRIASYVQGSGDIPEYLQKWPKVTNPTELRFFVELYRKHSIELGSLSMESYRERQIFESTGRQKSANDFHKELKERIRRGY